MIETTSPTTTTNNNVKHNKPHRDDRRRHHPLPLPTTNPERNKVLQDLTSYLNQLKGNTNGSSSSSGGRRPLKKTMNQTKTNKERKSTATMTTTCHNEEERLSSSTTTATIPTTSEEEPNATITTSEKTVVIPNNFDDIVNCMSRCDLAFNIANDDETMTTSQNEHDPNDSATTITTTAPPSSSPSSPKPSWEWIKHALFEGLTKTSIGIFHHGYETELRRTDENENDVDFHKYQTAFSKIEALDRQLLRLEQCREEQNKRYERELDVMRRDVQQEMVRYETRYGVSPPGCQTDVSSSSSSFKKDGMAKVVVSTTTGSISSDGETTTGGASSLSGDRRIFVTDRARSYNADLESSSSSSIDRCRLEDGEAAAKSKQKECNDEISTTTGYFNVMQNAIDRNKDMAGRTGTSLLTANEEARVSQMLLLLDDDEHESKQYGGKMLRDTMKDIDNQLKDMGLGDVVISDEEQSVPENNNEQRLPCDDHQTDRTNGESVLRDMAQDRRQKQHNKAINEALKAVTRGPLPVVVRKRWFQKEDDEVLQPALGDDDGGLSEELTKQDIRTVLEEAKIDLQVCGKQLATREELAHLMDGMSEHLQRQAWQRIKDEEDVLRVSSVDDWHFEAEGEVKTENDLHQSSRPPS